MSALPGSMFLPCRCSRPRREAPCASLRQTAGAADDSGIGRGRRLIDGQRHGRAIGFTVATPAPSVPVCKNDGLGAIENHVESTAPVFKVRAPVAAPSVVVEATVSVPH